MSLLEQVRTFGGLLDLQGKGYSARLKLLLHSGRPVLWHAHVERVGVIDCRGWPDRSSGPRYFDGPCALHAAPHRACLAPATPRAHCMLHLMLHPVPYLAPCGHTHALVGALRHRSQAVRAALGGLLPPP